MLAAALQALGGCTGLQASYEPVELPVINLANGTIEILSGMGPLSSPALSPDGKRLAVGIEVYRDRVLPYQVYSVAVAEKDQFGQWQQDTEWSAQQGRGAEGDHRPARSGQVGQLRQASRSENQGKQQSSSEQRKIHVAP